MNNIDRIKEYIQDAVISPLERLMNGDSGEPSVSLYEKYYMQGGYPPKDSVYATGIMPRGLCHGDYATGTGE